MKKIIFTLISLIIVTGFYAQDEISIINNKYHLYGPNSSWGQYLQVGGNGRLTTNASVVATNGNLHLDSKNGFSLYLNHYSLGNTYLNPQGGYVGIRTTNPTEPLHVSDVSGEFTFGRPGSEMNHRLTIDGNGGYENQLYFRRQIGRIFTAGKPLILGTSAVVSNLVVTTSGNIGIGTSNTDPNAGLHMFENRYTLYGPNTSWGEYLQVGGNGRVTSHASVVATNGNLHLDAKDGRSIYFNHYSLGNTYLNTQGGQVGIGTTAMGTHKLAVEGSIGAREIKVEANGWSDFVFDKNYKLRTLEELEKYIKEKGHLPEIPSEAEVTEHGINLGDMNAKLLQKIEELTLYLITMNKKLEKAEKRIKELENN